MYITKIENFDKKRKFVYFDDGSKVLLYLGEIRKTGLADQQNVSADAYDGIIYDILAKRAFKRCLHLLEKKDYTEKQIRDKLKMAYYPEDTINWAIEKCYGYGYIDDERYALRYMEYYIEKKSLKAIKMELVKKGISKSCIENAETFLIDQGEAQDCSQMIQAILRKRHYYDSDKSNKEKDKQFRYLMSKGFLPQDISRELKLDITN